MKKDIENLELTVKKAEQDKKEKDNQIKDLQTEMADREEKIGEIIKLFCKVVQCTRSFFELRRTF